MHKLGQDLGRFFEVGFNIGMLRYIQQKKMSHPFADKYLEQLRHVIFLFKLILSARLGEREMGRVGDGERIITRQVRLQKLKPAKSFLA